MIEGPDESTIDVLLNLGVQGAEHEHEQEDLSRIEPIPLGDPEDQQPGGNEQPDQQGDLVGAPFTQPDGERCLEDSATIQGIDRQEIQYSEEAVESGDRHP